MPDSWVAARDAYNYPVNLADFADKHKYPGFFESNICGCLDSTRAFQDRFRRNAPYHLEAWYEVIFWKMYSQNRKDSKTKDAIQNIRESGVNHKHLWTLCQSYLEYPERQSFRAFQKNLFSTEAVPIAMTFPAFLSPEKFPMVDSEITRWSYQNHASHAYNLQGGPVLSEPPDMDKVTTLLYSNTKHREFIESWIKWCRFTASKLHTLTGDEWSARDVEMAVFTAQWTGRTLNPLTDK